MKHRLWQPLHLASVVPRNLNMSTEVNMDIQAEIQAAEYKLEIDIGPFMPTDVAITRLCEAAVRAAQDKGDRQVEIVCAAARNVCERGL